MIHDDEYPEDPLPNWIRYGAVAALYGLALVGLINMYNGFISG